MGNQIYFKIAGKKKNGSMGRTARHIFGREPSKEIKVKFKLQKFAACQDLPTLQF
jgi:hypothetical protein